jgi:hypothetical protein
MFIRVRMLMGRWYQDVLVLHVSGNPQPANPSIMAIIEINHYKSVELP